MTGRRWWLLAAALATLALASSANGIRNGFTYDDQYIVFQNSAVHSLHGWSRLFASTYWPRAYGGDGYRPLTMLAFAAEWVMGNGAPWVFHAVNILLYCATTVAVFWFASALLPLSAAWLAAALFAVHPVHVEAVAGVVGQSELWVALLLTVAAALYVRGRRTGSLSPVAMTTIAVLYVIGCLAKENAIVFPALLAAAELTILNDGAGWRQRIARQRLFGLVLVLLAAIYLGVRSLVHRGDLAGFQPLSAFRYVHLSTADRVLTMIGVVPEWVRLFLWPARLSFDYAPPYIDLAQGPSITQIPGALMVLGALGLAIAVRRRLPVATLGVAWLCVTLFPVSNVLIATGVIVAERTLFLPSIGVVLALAALASLLVERVTTRGLRMTAGTALGVILLAGAARSASRTTAWHDNDTLFRQAVRDVPRAYRAHYMLGTWLFSKNDRRGGEREYRRALDLFPYDPYLALGLADQYRAAGLCAPAIPLYRWTYQVKPDFRLGRADYAWCLLMNGEPAAARSQALIGMAVGGENLEMLRAVVVAADSAMRDRRPTQSSERGSVAAPPESHGRLRRTVQKTP